MTRPNSLLMLRCGDVDGLLSLDDAIATQRRAFTSLSDGSGQLGVRVLLAGSDDSTVFSYAARLGPDTPPVCKFGSVVPANLGRGLPTVGAIVVALDEVTGLPRAVIDGEAVTRMRTVAASVLAAGTLSTDPRRVAVLGFGQQGRAHASALAKHLRPGEVAVWEPGDRDLGEELTQLAIDTSVDFTRAPSARAALDGADLIVCCTTSHQPLFAHQDVKQGATIISIGSFAPDRCEVGTDVVSSARLVVDHVPTAVVQAGPIVHALAEGAIKTDELTSLGDVLCRVAPSRVRKDETVLYTSVGVGIQDAAIVTELLRRAATEARGQHVPW